MARAQQRICRQGRGTHHKKSRGAGSMLFGAFRAAPRAASAHPAAGARRAQREQIRLVMSLLEPRIEDAAVGGVFYKTQSSPSLSGRNTAKCVKPVHPV